MFHQVLYQFHCHILGGVGMGIWDGPVGHAKPKVAWPIGPTHLWRNFAHIT